MSRFLGKIHYIMFDKINYVDEITRKMSELLDDNVDLKNIERGALEDLIDTDNIHGWLQVRVAIVEDNLARVLSELKKKESLKMLLKSPMILGRWKISRAMLLMHFNLCPINSWTVCLVIWRICRWNQMVMSSVGLRELMCTNSITCMENLLKFTMNSEVRGWMVCWAVVIWNTSWKMELIL